MCITAALFTIMILADVASFPVDPAIHDPRNIWFLETEARGNEIWSALEARGLAEPGKGSASAVNRAARDLVLTRVLERVNEVFLRRPDGTSVRGASIRLSVFADRAASARLPLGPGHDFSQICLGGRSRTCGGTLGVQFLDPGNQRVEWYCERDRIGVFAGRICGESSTLAPRLGRADLKFVDGTYALGSGPERDDDRFLAVRSAIEDWGTALGNVTAHEIGHALGLEHDRRRGYIMQARVSAADLSDRSLSLSPASLRVLARDVGIALARPVDAAALLEDRGSTIGALARDAASIAFIDAAGRVENVLADRLPAPAPDANTSGFIFELRDGGRHFIPADQGRERDAIEARIRLHAAGADPPAIAAGLRHWHPRIASDAALELLEVPEQPTRAEAAGLEEAIQRNAAAFEDLRPLVRLVARAGLSGSVERLIDLAAEEREIDLGACTGRALDALGGIDALRRRIARLPDGAARSRLIEVLLESSAPSIRERADLVEHEDGRVAWRAAVGLLRRGSEGRRALLSASARLEGDRAAGVVRLFRRPH